MVNFKKSHLLILEVVVCDVIQLREETSIGGILGAVEDALEDGLVLSIDVVVLQDTEDVSTVKGITHKDILVARLQLN